MEVTLAVTSATGAAAGTFSAAIGGGVGRAHPVAVEVRSVPAAGSFRTRYLPIG